MTRRNEQLNSVIHRAVQGVISQGFGDPRLEGSLITVTSTKITEDMRTAVISISVMPANHEARVLAGLKAASKNIRHRAARIVEVHRLPELLFKIDRSAKREAEVLSALDAVRQEWDKRGETAPEPQPQSPTQVDSQENQP